MTDCDSCALNVTCGPTSAPILEVDDAGRLHAFNAAAERALGALRLGLPITTVLARTPSVRWIIAAADDTVAARLTPLCAGDPDGALLSAATTGILARGITHDLNNLFTCILAVATSPPRTVADPARHMAAIAQAVLRGSELLSLLGELAPHAVGGCADLREVAAWCGLLLERVGAKVGVAVTVEAPEIRVALPPHELQQLVINLGLNAIDAMSEHGGGELEIRARVIGDRVRLSISDTGPGIAPGRLANLFAHGRSTKPGHRGVGLTVVRRIVDRAGGALTVESRVGQGTRFGLELPVAGGQA